MKVKLLGPVMGLVVGLGIAIGCGGSSSSDVNADAADSGTTTPPTPPTPPPNPPPPPSDGGPTDAKGDVFIPGTEVSVQYGSCATFTPCGGDPTGTWTYAAGGCLDAVDLSNCPQATITNPSIKVKGQVTFTGTASAGTVSRVAQVTISADAFVPNACTKNLPCAAIEFALKSSPPTGAGFDDASCTAMNNGCQCHIGKTQTDNGSEAYTATGNVITTGTGQTARTYDYCVNPANKFTYQETTASAQQKATLVMTK